MWCKSKAASLPRSCGTGPLTGVPELLSAGDHVYLVGHDTLGWTTDGSWPFILPDALGSVRQTNDATGAVTGNREWSPFGMESYTFFVY
ncbi:MAG: hypothetical protein JXA33_00785 [Anaerolineae bacterium]|nr:hypothetical protein [Anaerolineae bacterium]